MKGTLRASSILGASALLLSVCSKGEAQPPLGADVLNVEWKAHDPIGLPLNPHWRFQTTAGGLADPQAQCGGFPIKSNQTKRRGDPQCTDQATDIDVPTGWHSPVCAVELLAGGQWKRLSGHVNWRPVTVAGYLTWYEESCCYPFGDGDYTLLLEPDSSTTSHPGLTRYNTVKRYKMNAYHIEFSGPETVEHFGQDWWKAHRKHVKRNTVHPSGVPEPGQIPDGTYAVVTGLFGLDVEHKGHSELHPVYALSLLTSCAKTPDAEGYFNDEWAVFVRNWGNEGFCANWNLYHMLDLPNSVYAFRIPLPGVDPKSVTLGQRTRFFTNLPRAGGGTRPGKGPFLVSDPEGAEVRFQLPEHAGPVTRQNDPPRIHGLLHLRWKARGPISRACPLRAPLAEASPPELRAETPTDGEDVMRLLGKERLSRGLTFCNCEASSRPPDDTVEITDRTAISRPAGQPEIMDRVVRLPKTATLIKDEDEPPPKEVCEEAARLAAKRGNQTPHQIRELLKYCADPAGWWRSQMSSFGPESQSDVLIPR